MKNECENIREELKESNVTIAEKVKNYLDQSGKLTVIPAKKKNKLLAFMYLASKFEKNIRYKEKEVNEIIDCFHTFHDPCLLRRELYDHHLLDRSEDGSEYWVEMCICEE